MEKKLETVIADLTSKCHQIEESYNKGVIDGFSKDHEGQLETLFLDARERRHPKNMRSQLCKI